MIYTSHFYQFISYQSQIHLPNNVIQIKLSTFIILKRKIIIQQDWKSEHIPAILLKEWTESKKPYAINLNSLVH